MDVLLARQYNLISCVLQQDGEAGKEKRVSVERRTLGELGAMGLMGWCHHITLHHITLHPQTLLHQHIGAFEVRGNPLEAPNTKTLKQ